MSLQKDAKLLIEDTNIDRYIDDSAIQIKELSIGNFKIEIAGIVVLAITALTGTVPKIADYAVSIYKNNLSDIGERISNITKDQSLNTDQITILFTYLHSDKISLVHSISDIQNMMDKVYIHDPEVSNTMDRLKQMIMDNNTHPYMQNIIGGFETMRETFHNDISDYISRGYDHGKWIAIQKHADNIIDKATDTAHNLSLELSNMNALTDKYQTLNADKTILDHLSGKLDKLGSVVVWGVIFIVLSIIVISIIRKIMNSDESDSKKITPRNAMSFMKSTKRIISKSFKKKH